MHEDEAPCETPNFLFDEVKIGATSKNTAFETETPKGRSENTIESWCEMYEPNVKYRVKPMEFRSLLFQARDEKWTDFVLLGPSEMEMVKSANPPPSIEGRPIFCLERNIKIPEDWIGELVRGRSREDKLDSAPLLFGQTAT